MQDYAGYSVDDFMSQISSPKDEELRESLLSSFLIQYKVEAIRFITKTIVENRLTRRGLAETFPRNTPQYEQLVNFALKEGAILKAYANVAEKHDCPELQEVNRALFQWHFKLIPLVLRYKTPKVLDTLIQLYESLPIVYSKDWDGVSEKKVDMGNEAILISAICEFDDPKIIPSLKRSLLRGKYQKEKVITTLLQFITPEEVVEHVREYAEKNNVFTITLTDKPKNAKWVMKYLDEHYS